MDWSTDRALEMKNTWVAHSTGRVVLGTRVARLWGETRGRVKAWVGFGQIRGSRATWSGSRRGLCLRKDARGSSASRTGSCASLHGSRVCLGSSRNLIWNWKKKKISNWFQKLPRPSNFQKSLQLFPNHVRSNLITKTSIFSLQHKVTSLRKFSTVRIFFSSLDFSENLFPYFSFFSLLPP